MERLNKTYVIGKFRDLETRTGQANGKNYIAGSFKVDVTPENIVEHKFFSFETTTDNKPNSRYKNFADLQSFDGRRVKVSGEINSRAFYNSREGQVIHFNEINSGFVNLAKDTDASVATFEYSGYVIKPLHERMNKNEELVAYEIEVGQADYSGENLRTVRFTVDKNNGKMVNNIQTHYTKNTTISISGEIQYLVTVIEKTEEVMFGDPIVKTFENVLKTYNITGGKQPIVSDQAYTPAQISALESKYQEYLLQVEKDGKAQAESGQTTVVATQTKSDKSALL